MEHVSEGAIQALLDDGIGPDERAVVERHVDACGDCAAVLAELRDASDRLVAALALVDQPAPLDAAAGVVRRRRMVGRVASTRRALLRAATLVLGFAAVASAALPSSPVRDWALAAWRHGAALFGGETGEVVRPPAPAVPEAGISLWPVGGRVRIVVESPAQGARARVRMVDGDRVAVHAFGEAASARFRTGSGWVEIVEPGAGELRIDMPVGLAGAELEVDGRVVVSLKGDSLLAIGEWSDGRSRMEVVVDLREPASDG